MERSGLSALIKEKARAIGFDKVGIAAARPLRNASYLREWLQDGFQGEMHWMERYLEKRLDVTKLYPSAKSVVVVAHNYYTPVDHSRDTAKGKISRYAWGHDYHKIMRKKLKLLLSELRQIEPTLEGRLFVDSAPVQEKLWARQAGIGWQGKNTNLLTREMGSWIFLGELIVNKELICDEPLTDYCGRCTACIDACPTGALQPYKLDARKCISYLTIEHRDKPIAGELAAKMGNWIFGCDICQEVCPWNSFARETKETGYFPEADNIEPELTRLVQMSDEQFKKRFKKTPVFRAGPKNFLRNVRIALQNHFSKEWE